MDAIALVGSGGDGSVKTPPLRSCDRRLAAVALVVGLLSACGAAASDRPIADRVDAAVHEAETRFGMPREWLLAIIAAESAGDPKAVSSAGAMGLMQVMPGTWRDLRHTHGLGADPFDVRDNILAGAAYLRALHDRYGAPGFLAAYNAGPGRYEAFRDQSRPLPAETRLYVAKLTARLNLSTLPDGAPPGLAPLPDWRRASLFPAAPGSDAPALDTLFPTVPAARGDTTPTGGVP